MKRINLSQLIGYGIVALSIIISSFMVANKLPQTPYVPDKIFVTTGSETPVVKEFMSSVEAAFFLNLSERNFTAIVDSGELDGTFVVMNESYIFSKEKLTQWMYKHME